jgi:hypothetical protein
MSRRGQAATEAVLVALAVAALGAAGVRLAARSPVVAVGAAVRASARAAPAGGTAVAGDAVGIAFSLVGIREDAPNAGAAVGAFTDGHDEPWCADFVSWVLRAAGEPLTGGASGGWRVAGAQALRTWFVVRGRWASRSNAQPLPGDVVVFRHGHAGIVVAATEGMLETVEGNAGDAVAVRRYYGWRADADIEGFGRPGGLRLSGP